MTGAVRDQYEAYPYPDRDPAEEAKRLVVGSPSRPDEMDHYLFGGRRDWSQPLKALIAGGGTGDGLVQLAQLLSDAGRSYDITYLDLSSRARDIAEARAAARGLSGIHFRTGSLLSAPDLGAFDYIDCCGVLHHLPDPVEGAAALRQALAPGGGMGMMVYAPHGRSGVYPLQSAYGQLFEHLPPPEKLAAARTVQERLSSHHPFNRNRMLSDHEASDAGFYDLLLHSQDRAFSIRQLSEMLEEAGLTMTGLLPPVRYDLTRFAERPDGMDDLTAMAIAEDLTGTIKTHVCYAVPTEDAREPAHWADGDPIPVLRGDPARVSAEVAKTGKLTLSLTDMKRTIGLPRNLAPLIAAMDGTRRLSEVAAVAGAKPEAVGAIWSKLLPLLSDWGLLHFSGLHRDR